MSDPDRSNTQRSRAPILRRWPFAAGALVVVVTSIWLVARTTQARTDARTAARSPAIPVAVGEARRMDVPVYLEGLGTATAFKTVTVRTRVDGELVRVAFREGQDVRAGDVLAEIDPRPFQVQLQQAEGTLARDSAQLANATLDLERFRTLMAQELVSQQQLDAQQALVAQLAGTIQVDQAAIDSARLQLAYCRITAPIPGRVGLRLVDEGNMVHAADASGLVVLTQIRPMMVVFTLPEDDVRRVLARIADKAPLTVVALDRAGTAPLATGRLVTADNQIDPTTGTLRLKAVFDNSGAELFPNQFVNIRLLLETRAGRVVVPAAAVQRGQQGAFLFAVKPDRTVALKTVTLGPTVGDDVEITEGVAGGDTVVVDGADRLKDGAAVETPNVAAPAGAPPPRKKRT